MSDSSERTSISLESDSSERTSISLESDSSERTSIFGKINDLSTMMGKIFTIWLSAAFLVAVFFMTHMTQEKPSESVPEPQVARSRQANIDFITEPKKTVSLKLTDELDSDMSSSFRGNPALKSGEDVIAETEFVWISTVPSSIDLYSNLGDKKTAKESFKQSSCQVLVNGGFYDKSGSHIGLFIANSEVVSRFQGNKTFNAIFSINSDNVAGIGRQSFSSPRVAVQAGPILIEDTKVQRLTLASDAEKRRVVVAVLDNGEVIFFVFYKKDSVYIGPTLAQLPELVSLAAEKLNVEVTDALNLDGGTASAFLTDSVSLDELSPIGSYFCVR